jgi:signal transduction histidine kinase
MANSLAASVEPTTILGSPATFDLLWQDAMPERKSRAPKSGAGPSRRARTPRARSGTDASITTDLFFRHMVNSMRNGVLAIARDGRLVFANDVACRTLGVSVASSDLGRPFFEVLENSPDIVRILAGAFELSHLPNRAELRLKPSGKVIGYTLSHVRDERGRAVGAALFFKDLTRVEQIEERERLRDRLAALGEMAAAIAHEVKNPLAGIEVMAGLLKRQLPDSGDAHALLGDIIKDAKMANAIVLEVLDFVRPIRLQVERVSLSEVFQNAVTMAESKVARGRAEVAVTLDPDVPDIQGDEFQLRQLFTNLFTNAFEALGGKGHVWIHAQHIRLEDDGGLGTDAHASEAVIVDVSDDGPGLPGELVDRIFSPFFTTKPQGSGLGLAIVRKIVDAHDGRIDVSTRASGGTAFRVTLPLAGGHQLFQ